jgi:capsular polysaccharide biosynthesis protein
VPSAPAKPDRPTGLLISLLLALGLAVLTGVVLEMRDDSIRDTHEIKSRLPIPVLAVVPQMSASRAEKRFLMPEKATQSPPHTIQ